MALITSTASITQKADETYGTDNQAPLLSDWSNYAWDNNQPLQWGANSGKFYFLYDLIALAFRNMSPTIPPDAKIVSAILRMTAAAAGTGAFYTVLQVREKDGWWDPASTPAQWRKHGRAYSLDLDVNILTTGLASLGDTSVSLNSRYAPLLDDAIRNQQLGQSMTLTAGGTLGYADLYMVRTATAPSGSVYVQIWSQDGDGYPASLLAISDWIAASSIAVGAGAVARFAFSGGNQIALSNGQKIVAVVRGTYSPGANYVSVLHDTGYAAGTSMVYGAGIGYCESNYPLTADFQAVTSPIPLEFDLWVAPDFVAGVTYDSADFSRQMQAYIRGGTYAQGDPISVAINRWALFFPGGDVNRQIAQYGHATYTTPTRLIVQWRRRNRQVI